MKERLKNCHQIECIFGESNKKLYKSATMGFNNDVLPSGLYIVMQVLLINADTANKAKIRGRL